MIINILFSIFRGMGREIWYVYRHIRLDDNTPFYIGLGKHNLRGDKYYRSRQKGNKDRSEFWHRIVKKAGYSIDILIDNLTKKEAALKEMEFIRLYGRSDLGKGSLCNMTDGGDGIWGAVRSDKTRALLSEAKMGAKNPMFGKTQSKETIARKIASTTGLKRSEATKIKQSLASIESGQAKPCRVYKYKTGELVGEWHAISAACRDLGIHSMNGKAVMVAMGKGGRKQTKGYVFEYVNGTDKASLIASYAVKFHNAMNN